MMKSDAVQGLCIVLTSLFFLSAVIRPAEGKCAGKWAIHACWGGNGKRSDPSMDAVASPSLLRQLLLQESPVFPPVLDGGLGALDTMPDQDTPIYNSDYPDYPAAAAPTSNRLASLLRTLRSLQKENDDLP